MLRVASLAKIFIENWKNQLLDKDSIIKACLIHDIAKPLTFDPEKQSIFGMTMNEKNNLIKLQEMLKNKYGSEEHLVAVKIGQELGFNSTGVRIMEYLEWHLIPKIIEINDFESILAIYCDMRIGPKGILPLFERLMELENRESTKIHTLYQSNGEQLEEIIKKNMQINVNSITNDQINSHFEELYHS